jgi:hypothetical protein
MNNQSNFKEDLLRQYIGPEKIENAPEGFTSKVMTQIRLENVPVASGEQIRKRNLVPVISVLITLSLIAAAFLIPENQIDTVSIPVLKIIRNFKFSMPEVDISSLFRISLPSVTLYTIIGIACLTIFDKALSGIFKR